MFLSFLVNRVVCVGPFCSRRYGEGFIFTRMLLNILSRFETIEDTDKQSAVHTRDSCYFGFRFLFYDHALGFFI